MSNSKLTIAYPGQPADPAQVKEQAKALFGAMPPEFEALLDALTASVYGAIRAKQAIDKMAELGIQLDSAFDYLKQLNNDLLEREAAAARREASLMSSESTARDIVDTAIQGLQFQRAQLDLIAGQPKLLRLLPATQASYIPVASALAGKPTGSVAQPILAMEAHASPAAPTPDHAAASAAPWYQNVTGTADQQDPLRLVRQNAMAPEDWDFLNEHGSEIKTEEEE